MGVGPENGGRPRPRNGGLAPAAPTVWPGGFPAFPAAGGMPDMAGTREIEGGAQRREIVGVVTHAVTATGLRGPAVPTAIERDEARALVEDEQHLDIPIVSRKRPAMAATSGSPEPQSS